MLNHKFKMDFNNLILKYLKKNILNVLVITAITYMLGFSIMLLYFYTNFKLEQDYETNKK